VAKQLVLININSTINMVIFLYWRKIFICIYLMWIWLYIWRW